MGMRWLAILVMLFLSAPSFGEDHVKARLIADSDAIVAGKPFYIAVQCTIDPSWHIYWKNPGDSGQATSVKFELPAGFEVSDLMFPIPDKFLQPGDLIAYGYEETALFLAKVTPPKELASSEKISIKANLKYLVCQEVCIPGGATLDLSLAVSNSASPANEELFKTWMPKIPVPATDANSPATIESSGKLSGTSPSNFAVTLRWKAPVQDVEFFPGKSLALKLTEMTVQNKSQVTTVTFQARQLAGQKVDVDTLASVVAYRDGQGVRRGVEVNVPMKQ